MAINNKQDAGQWYSQNRGLYKKLSEKINNILNELLEEANITVHVITNRTKDVESFKNKIEDPKYDDAKTQITDLSGIRIIAYVEDDLNPICDIITDAFHIDENNSNDKSKELGTDKVGYRSIHYVARIKADRLKLPEYKKFKDLKFEIQVRTILQHAWAEIEHDRNYKFNGVLPPEIKRRFKILAGTLELIDREFNLISKEIDLIGKNVAIADKKDDLKLVRINSTTLKSYLNNHFKEIIRLNLLKPTLGSNDANIIAELEAFGVNTLDDLKLIIPQNLKDNMKECYSEEDVPTYLGLLRHIMIIKDAKKYFEKSWSKSWTKVRASSKMFLEKYLDISKVMQTYGLTFRE